MRSHTIALTLGTCAALTAIAADVPDEQLDVVIRHSGAKVAGTIVREDYLCVVVKRGAETKIPAHAVMEVQYGSRGDHYEAAVVNRTWGNHRVAAIFFAIALEKTPGQPWAAEHCNYGIGNALYSDGIFVVEKKWRRISAPPSVYLRRALEANPRSRFLPDLLPKLVRSLIEEQKLEDAAVALTDAQDRLRKYRDETKNDNGFRPIAERLHAQLSIAEALLAERSHADADETLRKWNAARFAATKFTALLAEAHAGEFRLMLARRDYEGVIAGASALIQTLKRSPEDTSMPALATAYQALGRAHFAKAGGLAARGMALQARSEYADARWAFTNATVYGFEDDNTFAAAHYFAGQCCKHLAAIEADGLQMARRHWRKVAQDYKRSEFSTLAEEELARLPGA